MSEVVELVGHPNRLRRRKGWLVLSGEAPAGPNEPEIHLRLDQPLPAAVELLEQTMVRRALERSQGRVEHASRLLGISRKGLFLKRRRWGLHDAS